MARRMLTLRLADDLVETLKQKAEADAIPMTELVSRLLRHGLNQTQSQTMGAEADLLEDRLKRLEESTWYLKDRLARLEGVCEKTERINEKAERTVGRCDTLENLLGQVVLLRSQ